MIENIILENNIYNDAYLRDFIISLESKYCISDEKEFFNSLVNFSKNKDIPYHRWFKYREGYSHALIKELIERSKIDSNEYILDPFCGSGTTIIEASINGYNGLGLDINPMSAFISEVKCRPYSDDEIAELRKTSKILDEYCNNQDFDIHDEQYRYKEVEKYFSTNNFKQLLKIKEFVDSLRLGNSEKIYDFFFTAYLCIIEKVSDRKRDGNGLKTVQSTIDNVFKYYLNQSHIMIEDIIRVRIKRNISSKVIFGNAMNLGESVNKYNQQIGSSVGAIMYSPPYANSFDYFESYKLEITLGDFVKNMKEINTYRQQAVESFVGRKEERLSSFDFLNWMANEIESDIPLKEAITGKRDSRTRKVPKMIKGYFRDMEKVIEQSAEVLTQGKRCYIVVDQSSYLGKVVPTDLFLAYIGEQHGFKINEIIVCRSAKTSGQQLQKYPYLKDILRESIVVMEKK